MNQGSATTPRRDPGHTFLVASAALGLATVLLTAAPGHGASINVGSFTKTSGVVPVSQAVAHGLGEVPKAIIFWTMGDTNESFTSGYLMAIGASDGSSSESAATSSQDNVNSSNAHRRMAFKAITILEWGGTVRAEADLQSWDATNVTLNWTTNSATADVVHFIAIGGAEVSAKVKDWVQKSGSTGNQAVTGIGFKPDLVIHVHCGAGFTTPPSGTGVDASLGLGVMDHNGNQWHSQFYGVDNSNTSDTQRYQRTTGTIAGIHSDLTVKKDASFLSMDSDGFTVNWSIVDAAASRVFSIALKGVSASVGSFAKSTGSATQAVTGVGFRPQAVLLYSFQDIARATVVPHSRVGIGASNCVSQGSSACQDTDALGTMSVESIDKTSKFFVKVDNNTPAVDAEASCTSLDVDGFTLTWTTNDAVATQILYLALAPRRRLWINQNLDETPNSRTRQALQRQATAFGAGQRETLAYGAPLPQALVPASR